MSDLNMTRRCALSLLGAGAAGGAAWWNSFAGAGRLPSDTGPNDSQELRREFLASYSNAITPGCGPEKCIRCKKCQVACPQWTFRISTEMEKIDRFIRDTRAAYLAKGGRL